MSFSEETKQIMKHYLELYLKGTIIREEQDVLDAYVEEIKNSTNPEDIAFVSTYQGKVNKTREETLAKEAEMKENGEVRVLKLNNPNGYVKVITIIIIWYLMATFGLLPPNIWPIMVPGKATSPITDILAISGLKDLMMAWRMKGACASAFVAPLPRRYR